MADLKRAFLTKVIKAGIEKVGAGSKNLAKKLAEQRKALQETRNAAASNIGSKEPISDTLGEFVSRMAGKTTGAYSHYTERQGLKLSERLVKGERTSTIGWGTGKFIWGLGRGLTAVPRGIGSAMVHYPVPFGIAAGGFAGMARHLSSVSEQRTQNIASKRMPANNLGTDGLTLSLSRCRHK